jgi:tetratricopeptide (TPR) repeat protein
VVVVNAHADPSKPVEGVRVSLSFVAGAEKVVDSRDATNRSGQALLLVSPEAVQRGNLRIEITGVTGLVVFEPADGQLNGLPATITIKMLPQGSLALLGPTQIEAMLHRLSLQNKHLEQENRVVKGELAAAQGQKPDDLAQAMTEWATANGFAAADADKRIQEWAKEIQTRKDQATAEQQELAELALKHYAVAAPMFHKDATDRFAALREKQQRDREEDRKEFQAAVDKQYQSANAYQLASQYHQATQVLEDTRDEAAEQHRISPEDPAYRSIWLDTVLRLADARKAEGASGKASESAALLAQSIKDYRELLKERSAQAERQDWARAQTNLGLALSDQGERSSGSEATSLFAQAVEAYRAALGVYTKADLPQGWAMTQSNLGIALWDQGTRTSGAQATELLAQSVEAYRAALGVYTKADLPQYWAATQNNLGIALSDQGERSSGSEATSLFAQAVEAYRAALEVYTKADLPQDWAMTQNNLGIALWDQGERSSGAEATELLAQSVEAYRAALEVRTKADLPQDWASTQNNLGTALSDQGERSSGAEATKLLAQSVEAYRAVLEVYTKADLPQDWAMTQSNLGIALRVQGERSSGAEATELLSAAASAFESVLEVSPTSQSIIKALSHIDHEELFRFDRALELDEQAFKIDPSTGNRMDLVEASLTAAHFSQCVEQAVAIDDPVLSTSKIPVRDTIKLACQWGAGQKAAAQQTATALLPQAAGLHSSGWSFAGTRHFLASSPAFEPGRASWIALFESLEKGDGAAMAAALHQLDAVMNH